MVIQIFVNYIDSNEKTRKVDSWVKIKERSYVPFDMHVNGYRARNLGSTNSAIIYIKVFFKSRFRCRNVFKKKYLAVDIP